jgi:hypothetical protein
MFDELLPSQRRELERLTESQRTISSLEQESLRAALSLIDAQAERLQAIEGGEREYRVVEVRGDDVLISYPRDIASYVGDGEIQSRVLAIGPWVKHEEEKET